MCGSIQLTVDIIIVIQIMMYKSKKTQDYTKV